MLLLHGLLLIIQLGRYLSHRLLGRVCLLLELLGDLYVIQNALFLVLHELLLNGQILLQLLNLLLQLLQLLCIGLRFVVDFNYYVVLLRLLGWLRF